MLVTALYGCAMAAQPQGLSSAQFLAFEGVYCCTWGPAVLWTAFLLAAKGKAFQKVLPCLVSWSDRSSPSRAAL